VQPALSRTAAASPTPLERSASRARHLSSGGPISFLVTCVLRTAQSFIDGKYRLLPFTSTASSFLRQRQQVPHHKSGRARRGKSEQ
jgi:hypothetical protein